MGKISLWVVPGSSHDELRWDPWRRRWIVHCQAPPARGEANRAILGLLAQWLGVPANGVRWVSAGTSRSKCLHVDGLTDEEASDRLRAAEGQGRPKGSGAHPR